MQITKIIIVVLGVSWWLLFGCNQEEPSLTVTSIQAHEYEPVMWHEGRAHLPEEVRGEPPAPIVTCNLTIMGNTPADLRAELLFKNTASVRMRLLKRRIVLEESLTWSPLVVTRNDEQVHYEGITVAWVPSLSADDYIIMEPGDTITSEVQLLRYYDVDRPGQYTIRYAALDSNEITPEPDMLTIESNRVTFKVIPP